MESSILLKKIKSWMSSTDIIDASIYNTYLKKLQIEIVENTLFLIVSSQLPKKYLLNVIKEITDKINQIDNSKKYEVLIVVPEELEKKKKVLKSKLKISSKSDSYTFNNFISGCSNRAALNASYKIIESPGKKYNPLFIYGKSGLGKTHLLKSIKNKFLEEYGDVKVQYYISSDFRKEVTNTLQFKTGSTHESVTKFKDRLSNLDLLLIDDIQLLSKSDKTIEIFFDIFNFLVENNKQIVITSDQAPENLNGFDRRIVSRFISGLTTKIDKPDDETAYKIVEFKAKQNNLNFSNELIKYIAKNFGTEVRRIEGIINAIDFWLLNSDIKVSENKCLRLNDVEQILDNFSANLPGEITPLKIKEHVAAYYNVSVKAIDSRVRTAQIANARHVAIYLVHDILRMNTTEIGTHFGRDHTTVLNSNKKVTELLKKDKTFKSDINRIKYSIKNS